MKLKTQRLRMKVNNLENNVLSLEINGNHFKQYGKRNNLKITEIQNDVSEKNLEEKVIHVLSEIQVNLSGSDVEACHRIGKSRNSSKTTATTTTTTIVQFINSKQVKRALINSKGLIININKFQISLASFDNIFINSNLTPLNSKIAFHYRKLKQNGQIDKTYSGYRVIHIGTSNIRDKN